MKYVTSSDGKYDVVFTLTNTKEKGLDSIYLQPAVFRSRNDKRDVSGRCRVPNCPSFIRDCRHVQPNEFADILVEKIEKRNKTHKQNKSTYIVKLTQQKRANATAQAFKTRMGCRLADQHMETHDPRIQNEDMGSQT